MNNVVEMRDHWKARKTSNNMENNKCFHYFSQIIALLRLRASNPNETLFINLG